MNSLMEAVVFLIAFNPTNPSDTIGVLYEYEGPQAMMECQQTADALNRGEIGTDVIFSDEPVYFSCQAGWISATVDWE